MVSSSRSDLPRIKVALARDWQALVAALSPRARVRGDCVRFNRLDGTLGDNPKFSVSARGFYDFSADRGGSHLDYIMAARQVDFRGALDWARDWLGLSRPVATKPRAFQLPTALALRADCLATRYLRARGLSTELVLGLPDLRFDPAHSFGDDGSGPALIALIRHLENGQVQGLSALALGPDGGKAAIPSPRRFRGAVKGGAVMLSDPNADLSHLAVAEGVEDALSLRALGHGHVYACLSTGGMAALPPLSGVERLSICPDRDAPGLKAAITCAATWRQAGRSVDIHCPANGKDWNEALRHAHPEP